MAIVEPETLKASTGWGMGTGYPPPRPTKGFVGSSVVSSPPAGSVAGPGEKKRFYCFLGVPERLPLQRLLKINVVHSRPLIEKKMGFLNGLVLIHLGNCVGNFVAVLALAS